jgi:transcriptional regulator with XRE-family HTH domain
MQSIHDFVVERLLDTRGSWSYIAKHSGVSKRTLEKIARREIKDPGVSNIEKLANFFWATRPKNGLPKRRRGPGRPREEHERGR